MEFFSDSYTGTKDQKINEVRKIYANSGAKSSTKLLIGKYLNEAMEKLEMISIDKEKKEILKDFVNNYIFF